MAVSRAAQYLPVPVHCLSCDGRRGPLRRLRQAAGVRLVESPRHAEVLVVAGDIPPDMAPAVHRVHDQVPEPRGVALWSCGNGADLFGEEAALSVRGETGIEEALTRLHQALTGGSRPTSPLFGPGENPVDWQGTGDHGQGGEGMMGGKPYGRPMPMTGSDIRDGLMLGSLQFELGPFISWMPPGLRLSVSLQGDVIQGVSCKAPRLDHPRDVHPIFTKAMSGPVSVAELETARARHHLEAVSDLLYLLELDGYGLVALQLAATAAAGKEADVRGFMRKLRRTGLFLWSLRGAGSIPKDDAAGLGPVSRAAGIEEDARTDDPAYKGLAFHPISQGGGDAGAICRQRLDEAVQALELAARAGKRMREPAATLEGPRGPMEGAEGDRWQALLENRAKGMAWDDFVTFLVSLDLDVSVLPPADDYADADKPQGS